MGRIENIFSLLIYTVITGIIGVNECGIQSKEFDFLDRNFNFSSCLLMNSSSLLFVKHKDGKSGLF